MRGLTLLASSARELVNAKHKTIARMMAAQSYQPRTRLRRSHTRTLYLGREVKKTGKSGAGELAGVDQILVV